MKGLILKIIIVVLLVICFGSGIWQTIDYVEDRIIEKAINLIDNSEFVEEIRTMVQNIAKEVIYELLEQGYDIVLNDGTNISIAP